MPLISKKTSSSILLLVNNIKLFFNPCIHTHNALDIMLGLVR